MNTKVCTNCKTEKELSEFRIVKGKYYRGECRTCEANYSIQKRKRITNIITEAKEDGCKICGENRHPSLLDFHHLKDKDMDFKNKFSWSEKRIKNELSKCVVLCANCHRLIHAKVIDL